MVRMVSKEAPAAPKLHSPKFLVPRDLPPVVEQPILQETLNPKQCVALYSYAPGLLRLWEQSLIVLATRK